MPSTEPGPDGSEIPDLPADLLGAAARTSVTTSISPATVASQIDLARGFIGQTETR